MDKRIRLTGADMAVYPDVTHYDCECWLAMFSPRECERPDGMLWRVHLLPKQQLRRRGADPWDPRAWVWACGGSTGLNGCHELLDSGRLLVPLHEIPEPTIELAEEAGMLAWLDHRYGS